MRKNKHFLELWKDYIIGIYSGLVSGLFIILAQAISVPDKWYNFLLAAISVIIIGIVLIIFLGYLLQKIFIRQN